MSKLAVGLKLYGAPTTGNTNDYEAKDFGEIVREWDRAAPNKPILLHAGKHNLEEMIEIVGGKLDHHLHVCHVNDPADVRLVNQFKKKSYPVSCGVTPHHLLKNSQSRKTEGQFAEMMPPLAHQLESEGLMSMLAWGEIDIVESDYAPHTKDAKWEAEQGEGSCFGVPGIEHIVPLLFYQAKKGNITYDRLVDSMSRRPAQLLGVSIESDTYTKWELSDFRIESEEDLKSGAGWTPYLGNLATGKIIQTKISGKTVMGNGLPVKKQHELMQAHF